MNLRKRLARILHNATRSAPAPAVSSPNAGPTIPAQRPRGVVRVAQVDGVTVTLPPVQSPYSGQRPNIRAFNRSNQQPARRGSTRQAVGL